MILRGRTRWTESKWGSKEIVGENRDMWDKGSIPELANGNTNWIQTELKEIEIDFKKWINLLQNNSSSL